MSIFRRDSDRQSPVTPTPAPAPAPSQPQPQPKRSAPPPTEQPQGQSHATRIATSSKFVGEISGEAELVIDGRVEGEIDLASRVVIGAKGHVKGQVRAKSVQVGGHIQGNVIGEERVEVLTSGKLEGDVLSPRVVIAEGAFFKGKVEMTDKIPARPAGAGSAGAAGGRAQESKPGGGKDSPGPKIEKSGGGSPPQGDAKNRNDREPATAGAKKG